MSEKKSKAKTGKSTAENNSKKTTSGKVTKPLRRVSAAKSEQKNKKTDNKKTL